MATDCHGDPPLARSSAVTLTDAMDEVHTRDRERDANIVLTGFMGTGKTTVGRRLADRLGFEFVDTDRMIEERHGPIPVLFAMHGEDKFRRLEAAVAAELAGRRRHVIATGGRLMVDPDNADVLGASGRVVCLVADVDTILARVTGTDLATRPMLSGDDPRGRIVALLAERSSAYGRFEQVVTDGRTPDEVVDAIVAVLDRPAP